MSEVLNEDCEPSSENKWIPSKTCKKIVWYKGRIPYLDFTYRGNRIRYNLTENLLERCERLKCLLPGNEIPKAESELFEAVIVELANLEPKALNATV